MTVADNACGNCHVAHGAGYAPRLLRENFQEDTCLNCHDGSVAAGDILSLITEFSAHTVHLEDSIHDPTEDPDNFAIHIECSDCHNPHKCYSSPASAPLVSGALESVSGVTSTGVGIASATYEYEVCYKCHADNLDRPTAIIPRQITQTNVRLEFDPGAISFHPIETTGRNLDVPSLKAGWTEQNIMYCSDCHNSPTSTKAGGAGPDGPHGSEYEGLLIENLDMNHETPESPTTTALCYRCHDRNSILADEGFAKHARHVDEGPCTVCHDPHGISQTQGNTTNNTHLINFDTRASIAVNGTLEFIDTGFRTGECTLNCHGKKHRGANY